MVKTMTHRISQWPVLRAGNAAKVYRA
jgi:hypothetical protein